MHQQLGDVRQAATRLPARVKELEEQLAEVQQHGNQLQRQ